MQHWGIVSVFISRSSIDRCLGSNLLAVLWDEEEEAEDDVENCCFTRVPLVFLYSRDMQHHQSRSLSPQINDGELLSVGVGLRVVPVCLGL